MINTAELTDIYKKSVETFETALKNGVKIQADSAQLINDAVKKNVNPQDWSAKSAASIREIVDLGTKNMDTVVSQVNKNAQTGLDVMKSAFAGGQVGSMADLQAKTTVLWETALSALRENTQAVISINARTVETLTNLGKPVVEVAQ